MQAEDLAYKQKLIATMDKAEQGKMVRALTEEWLEAYQGRIIEDLKTCQDNRVMGLRNLLIVSEDFRDWINATINNGALADTEFKEIEEEKRNVQPNDDWYKNL